MFLRRCWFFLCWCALVGFAGPQVGLSQEGQPQADGRQQKFVDTYKGYSAAIEKGDYVTAAPLAKTAFELGQIIYGPDSETTATLAYNHGLALLRSARIKESYPILQQAVDMHEKLFGNQSEKTLSVALDTTRSAVANKYYSQAQEWLNRIEAMLAVVIDPVLQAEINFELGVLDLDNIRSGRAEKFLLNSYREYQKAYGENNSYSIFTSYYLARHYLIERDYPTAQKYLTPIVEPFSDREAGDINYARVINAFLAATYFEQGETAKGEQFQAAAMALTDDESRDQPIILLARDPDLPARAETNNLAGFVLLSYNIDSRGQTTDIEIQEVNGYAGFQTAAVNAVTDWRFLPRYRDGKAVAVTGQEARLLFGRRQ